MSLEKFPPNSIKMFPPKIQVTGAFARFQNKSEGVTRIVNQLTKKKKQRGYWKPSYDFIPT